MIMTFKEAKAKVIEILKENGVNIPKKPVRITWFEQKVGRTLSCSGLNYAKELKLYRKIHKRLNDLTRDFLTS